MSNATQIVYGGIALLGLGATQYFNIQFMTGPGPNGAADFMAGGFANPASSSFSVDLFVATLAFLVWSFRESRRLGMRAWWAYLAATFFVAVAVSFPVFLLMRERTLDRATPGPG